MSWSSGTNTIAEGGEAKNLTLQMLEVQKQSGGTEYFVRKSDVTLGTKSITQNGTYTAASDGKYGYSQVSVNVRGGNGSADSSGKPSTSPNAPKPGGSGSAVVGTDLDTGNEQVVGVDEDGVLVTTPLPSSIVVVTNPTKMSYTDGESIDLSGAVVVAKNADGTTWTSADYPNGHVSCTPEPTIATSNTIALTWARPADGKVLSTSLEISIGTELDLGPFRLPIPTGTSNVVTGNCGTQVNNTYTVDNGLLTHWWEYESSPHRKPTLGASSTPGNYRYVRGTANANNSMSRTFTFNGKTVYYSWDGDKTWREVYSSTIPLCNGGAVLGSPVSEEYVAHLAWYMIYGGSSHTTESSSGTSGSGGGGTF